MLHSFHPAIEMSILILQPALEVYEWDCRTPCMIWIATTQMFAGGFVAVCEGQLLCLPHDLRVLKGPPRCRSWGTLDESLIKLETGWGRVFVAVFFFFALLCPKLSRDEMRMVVGVVLVLLLFCESWYSCQMILNAALHSDLLPMLTCHLRYS